MSSLVEYLKSTKRTFSVNHFHFKVDTNNILLLFQENLNSCLDVHIVIGNESSDLDSTVSSLILAYFLDKYRIPQIPNTGLIIPVLNVSYEHFLLRTENCFVLQKCGIPLTSLIYR